MALTPYQQLEQEFRRLHAFRSAASILRWDSAVMMPRGSSLHWRPRATPC
jgi:Zn-dependent M32 family carboxypeptidase